MFDLAPVDDIQIRILPIMANLIDFSALSCIEPVVLIVGGWHAFKHSQQEKKASLNLHETRLSTLRDRVEPNPGPCSEIMLRCSGSSHHFAAPTLPAPAFAPKRADARRSKNARKETRSGGEKRPIALPAHLGDVVRDLSRFFLQLFPFCGRDRFVSRGD
jgi:hypothetical protein